MLSVRNKMEGWGSARWITGKSDTHRFNWMGGDFGVGEMGVMAVENWSDRMMVLEL